MNRPSSALPTARHGEATSDNHSALSLERFLFTLRTGDFQSRWDAAKSIPSFGEAAIAPLLSLLGTADAEEEELVWFVAKILGNIQHPQAINSLIQVLQSSDSDEVSTVVAMALANYGLAAVPLLQAMLHQPATRRMAVQAMAHIQHPCIVPPLLTVVQDPDAEVRATVLETLSHFSDPDIVTALSNALQDPTAAVRYVAVAALGRQAEQGDRATLATLLRPLLWDLNLDVCRQSAIALGRVGTNSAMDALATMLQSPHSPALLQLEGIYALARIGTVAALQPLDQFLNRQDPDWSDATTPNHWVAREITAVLGRVEDPEAQLQAGQILLTLLQTQHPLTQTPEGKRQIALSLGQLGNAESIPALIALLADPNASVRFHVIAALKQLEPVGAYAQLQHLNQHLNQQLDQPEQSLENLQTDINAELISTELKSGIQMALQEW